MTAYYKGNVTIRTDRRGHATTTIADLAGRTTMSIDSPADASSGFTYTKYGYGPFSNLVSVRDHRG